MEPYSCTPKNNFILGIKISSHWNMLDWSFVAKSILPSDSNDSNINCNRKCNSDKNHYIYNNCNRCKATFSFTAKAYAFSKPSECYYHNEECTLSEGSSVFHGGCDNAKKTYWKYWYYCEADKRLECMIKSFRTVEIIRTQSIMEERNDSTQASNKMQDLIQRYVCFHIHCMNIIIGYIIRRDFVFIS